MFDKNNFKQVQIYLHIKKPIYKITLDKNLFANFEIRDIYISQHCKDI